MMKEIGTVIGGEHYLAAMLILLLSCILISRSALSERVKQDSFWITLAVCALLVLQNVLESVAQLDPARRNLRMITSIAGYALRPVAALGFLLVIWPPARPKWFLWIPAVLNGLLYGSAVFIPLTFSFDEEYHLQRGPLNWAAVVAGAVYRILILFTIHARFKDRRGGDMVSIYLCALCCVGAMWVDVLSDGVTLPAALLISCLVLYLFLRTQDIDHDPLTRLWTRRVFYEDCNNLKSAVTAVASVDMNGLKRTNDELGHEAGDQALRMIARGFRTVTGKKIRAYRTGGDEFMVLFIHCSEEEIRRAIAAFQDEMSKLELSIAVGLATVREQIASLDEMISVSDRRMYEDKSRYYRIHDRRRRN